MATLLPNKAITVHLLLDHLQDNMAHLVSSNVLRGYTINLVTDVDYSSARIWSTSTRSRRLPASPHRPACAAQSWLRAWTDGTRQHVWRR